MGFWLPITGSYRRQSLDWAEIALIEAARDRGVSWAQLGQAQGGVTEQAMQQRYRRLGGKRTWPAGRKPVGADTSP